MTISGTALRETFRVLTAAGFRPPTDHSDETQLRLAISAWSAAWEHGTDDELRGAAMAFLQTDAKWWPKPGELRALVPKRERRAVRQLPERRPIDAFATGPVGVALIDQAIGEVWGSCGGACSLTCSACADAAINRADELALEHLKGAA